MVNHREGDGSFHSAAFEIGTLESMTGLSNNTIAVMSRQWMAALGLEQGGRDFQFDPT